MTGVQTCALPISRGQRPLLRATRPDVKMPFRMRLYPLPSLIALAGWVFVLGTQERFVLEVALGATAAGIPAFFIWKSFTAGPTAAQS